MKYERMFTTNTNENFVYGSKEVAALLDDLKRAQVSLDRKIAKSGNWCSEGIGDLGLENTSRLIVGMTDKLRLEISKIVSKSIMDIKREAIASLRKETAE